MISQQLLGKLSVAAYIQGLTCLLTFSQIAKGGGVKVFETSYVFFPLTFIKYSKGKYLQCPTKHVINPILIITLIS